MVCKQAVFQILRNEKSPCADDALLAALRGADLATAQAIVETLLIRNRRAGLYGLVAGFHELDEPLRQQILQGMDKIFSVLRAASQSSDERVRLNVLEVIHRGCAYRAAYLVDMALHDRSARVREAAAETLYTLAEELLRTSPVPVGDEHLASLAPEQIRLRMADLEFYAEDRRQVVGAVESGLASFGLHLHPRVVEAAMWFVDDLGAKFWAVVSAPGSRAARAAIGILSRLRDIRLIPFMITALNYAEFRPHVVTVLAECTDAIFLAEWLRQSWRIVQPKTTRGMTALKELACVGNQAAELLGLPADAQRHLPRWIAATGLAEVTKTDVLKEVERRGDRKAQRSAVWALTAREDEYSTRLLRRLANDDDAEFARIARHELARRRPLEYRPYELILGIKEGVPAGGVVRQAASPETFDRYWSMFDELSEEDRVKFGQEILARSPPPRAFLGRQLIEAEPSSRIRALRMITVLGLVEEFAERLYQLSYDAHPEVRSAAVSALGRLADPTSKRILQRALIDEDARVQANAVEAVAASGNRSAAMALLPKLASEDNRVRANAVKALLKLGVREAAETLLAMLGDPSRAQRISALWLIDHMGLFSLATRVMHMAAFDEDLQVRDRAAGLADRVRPPGALLDREHAETEVLPSSR